jgi:hypothetical protein
MRAVDGNWCLVMHENFEVSYAREGVVTPCAIIDNIVLQPLKSKFSIKVYKSCDMKKY